MPWRGRFGRILTMQLEPPKILMTLGFFLKTNITIRSSISHHRNSPLPLPYANTRHLPLGSSLLHHPSPRTPSPTLLSQWIQILTAIFSATLGLSLPCR